MKIVVAPDSFKGNLRSAEVGEIMRRAILSELPEAEVVVLPMADGGEGTVEAMVAATDGTFGHVVVDGPLGAPVKACYGVLPDGTAVMEMASASGIELLRPDQLDPMQTSTFGTGELLRFLIKEGHRTILMGIGSSATVDGGVGMAQALGYRFLDGHGDELTMRGGATLAKIRAIDDSGVYAGLKNVQVRVACDVTNPLTGSNGAAVVFGPQKGATPQMVEQLDAGLANLFEVCGGDGAPGDGAAGGLGYALRVFCNAEIVPGAGLVAEAVGLTEALEGADLLITGEGRTDGQTAAGKLCAVLAELAREREVRTLLLSGALHGDLDAVLERFDYAFSISSGHASLAECIAGAPVDLGFSIRNIIRLLCAGKCVSA